MNPMRTAESHGRDRALAAAAADDGYHHDPREETKQEYLDRARRERDEQKEQQS